MKNILVGILFLVGTASVANAETPEFNDCSSKYERPILVRTSYGTYTPLFTNTRTGWCTPSIDSPFFNLETSFSEPSGGKGGHDHCGGYGGHGRDSKSN